MPYVAFHEHFAEVAQRETRVATISPGASGGLPPGEYLFIEQFCDEPGCDCRRVFLNVWSTESKDVMAVIAWGWEPPEYYARWMGDRDPLVIRDLKGPSLNLASEQSSFAQELLEFVQEVLLRDPAYVERLKRHYAMFRERIDAPRFERKP